MNDKYLIGVDLGTSATKAALYRPDGTLVAEASAEVPIYYPKPGVVEQENDDFYRTAAQTVSQCLSASGVDPHAVAAIAFDSQMAGIGSVDEAFRPATRFAIARNDTHPTAEADSIGGDHFSGLTTIVRQRDAPGFAIFSDGELERPEKNPCPAPYLLIDNKIRSPAEMMNGVVRVRNIAI